MGTSIFTEREPSVRVIASDSTWIEGASLRQLHETAKLSGMRAVVGMPDLHPGKGSPVGAAFLTEGFIHPLLVGSDIGCGMALLRTDLAARKARPEKLAERMNGLDAMWDGDASAWLSRAGVEETPYDASLGTTGLGNHFIEVVRLHEVTDETACVSMGLSRDRLALIVHSGSRGLGEAILRGHAASHGASPLEVGSPGADAYLAKHDHAVRWAAANRALCGLRACEALGTDGDQVLDICHNSMTPMVAGGCSCWLHRKGAAPADKGPVIIPGSRGDLTYLVRPVTGRDDALRSLAHGAGRKIARQEARGKLRGLYRREDLLKNPFGGQVVCGEEQLAWEEAPECYKDIASVVGDLAAEGLVEVIATFQPVVTFKTSRGVREHNEADRKERQNGRHEARARKAKGMFR